LAKSIKKSGKDESLSAPITQDRVENHKCSWKECILVVYFLIWGVSISLHVNPSFIRREGTQLAKPPQSGPTRSKFRSLCLVPNQQILRRRKLEPKI